MVDQPQTIQIQFVNVAGTSFLLQNFFGMLISIDWRGYEVGKKDRQVVVVLVGPYEMVYENEDADDFKLWWEQSTGQARIQPAAGLFGVK